jgi:hypothetical protein
MMTPLKLLLPLLSVLLLPVAARAQTEIAADKACAALTNAGFEGIVGAATRIVSARLQNVPAQGLAQPPGPMTFPIRGLGSFW